MTCAVQCPVCGAPETIDLGPPAHRRPLKVAGVPIDVSDLNLRHRRCPTCEYQFVFPRIPQQRLIDCYARSADHWGTGADVAGPRSYAHKKELLERFAPQHSALDFGCYDGGFLDFLGPGWSKAGIEPSSHAAQVARSRGVEIIGTTLDSIDVDKHASKFGAIIIFDVMEHLPDPVADLKKLRELLAPGGIIFIETGNTDAREWQRFGTRHPYAGIVEHIGFFNRKSIQTAGQLAGLSLAHFEASIHFDNHPNLIRNWTWIWLYRGICSWKAMGLPLTGRLGDIAAGPFPRVMDLKDHFLAILRRE
jgi:SAM-dependent methyltransferase